MDKSNLELFKQAINEGLNNKINNIANSYVGDVACSEKHTVAMRAIVYGKTDSKRTWSPKMKRIVAILIAAALLLTSCGIIFRNEIREMIDEFFASITFSENDSSGDTIKEIYELGYLPEGYYLVKEQIKSLSVSYDYADGNGNIICFKQTILNGANFVIDNESGYSEMLSIENYTIYHRYTNSYHNYLWTDGKYVCNLISNHSLSNEEIKLIFEGIK